MGYHWYEWLLLWQGSDLNLGCNPVYGFAVGIHTCKWENEWKLAERHCSVLMGPVRCLALYSINKDFVELDQRRQCTYSLWAQVWAFKVHSGLCEMKS